MEYFRGAVDKSNYRPTGHRHIDSWYIERAAGLCYDKAALPSDYWMGGGYLIVNDLKRKSMGSAGRTAPTTDADKAAALKACKKNLSLLKAEVAASPMDRQMAQCKVDIEQVRIQRNRQKLLDAGVDAGNIECFSHRTVDDNVQSWYVERAAGLCNDKTASSKPSRSQSMGSAGRTAPTTDAEKAALLKACQKNLARLQKNTGSSTGSK